MVSPGPSPHTSQRPRSAAFGPALPGGPSLHATPCAQERGTPPPSLLPGVAESRSRRCRPCPTALGRTRCVSVAPSRLANDVVARDGGVHRLGAGLAGPSSPGRLDPGHGVLVDELVGVAGRQLLLQSGPDLLGLVTGLLGRSIQPPRTRSRTSPGSSLSQRPGARLAADRRRVGRGVASTRVPELTAVLGRLLDDS